VTVPAAVATLLEGLVDYAGLFPPAALEMEQAVARYARYRHAADHAMLGRFVLPAARLDAFVAAVDGLRHRAPTPRDPWGCAVLASSADAPAITAVAARVGGCLRLDVIEAKASDVSEIEAIAAAFGPTVTVYVEVSAATDPASLIAALARHGLRAKLRTGGVTADAFPTPAEVLRFLVACHASGVAFKATAGLHHPLRGEYPLTYAPESPRATMYGFLNVFLAAAFLRAGVGAEAVAPLLEERDATAIRADADGITWRGWRLSLAALADVRRTGAASFGSCSFEEPSHEIAALAFA
jgi:hypothetical protein